MLEAVPSQHGVLPSSEIRILGRIPGILCIFQDARDRIIPHDEGEVGVCALVTHEPAAVCEMGVEDFSDAVDFVVVAFAGRWQRFGMVDVEPGEFEEVSWIGEWDFDEICDMVTRHTMLLDQNMGLGLTLGSKTTARGRMSPEMKGRSECATCHKS